MYGWFCFVFTTICSMAFEIEAATTNYVDNNPIIFPGPTQEVKTQYGSDERENNTKPCAGLTYCTVKPDNYPQDVFNKMFKGKYKEPIFHPNYIMTGNRQGDPSELTGCDSTVTYDPLYNVRSKGGEWRTVVQAPEENYLQLVRIETCNDNEGKCFKDFNPPPGVKSFCKETYGSWEFLVYNDKNETEKIVADLPICCSCHYKNV